MGNPALIFPPGDVNYVNALTCRDGQNRDVRNVLRLFPEGKSPSEIEAYLLTALEWPVPLLDTGPGITPETAVSDIIACEGRPLDTVSYWVQVVGRGRDSLLGENPPAIELQLRSGLGATTELQTTVTILPPAWNDAAMAFQFSGVTTTRFELWGGTLSGGAGRPAREVRITWGVMVSYKGCCEKTTIPGPWVVGP